MTTFPVFLWNIGRLYEALDLLCDLEHEDRFPAFEQLSNLYEEYLLAVDGWGYGFSDSMYGLFCIAREIEQNPKIRSVYKLVQEDMEEKAEYKLY